jgi:hypothetical protein
MIPQPESSASSKAAPLSGRELFPGENDAGNLLKISDKDYISPIIQQIRECFLLAVADFEGKQTAGFERAVGLGDETAIDIEAKSAGKKGVRRLVIADLGMESGAVAFRNIRRIADDDIEDSGLVFLRETRQQVGQEEVDAAGQIVSSGVLASYFEGFGREVDGSDLGIGKMGGECQSDGAGAGADIENMERLVVRETFQNGFNEVLGLGAGDERGGGDFELESKELLLAGNVLDGLVAEAASDGSLINGKLQRREDTRGISEERGAIKTKDVQKQKLRIAMGLVAEMRAGRELFGGESECQAQCHVAGAIVSRLTSINAPQ